MVILISEVYSTYGTYSFLLYVQYLVTYILEQKVKEAVDQSKHPPLIHTWCSPQQLCLGPGKCSLTVSIIIIINIIIII